MENWIIIIFLLVFSVFASFLIWNKDKKLKNTEKEKENLQNENKKIELEKNTLQTRLDEKLKQEEKKIDELTELKKEKDDKIQDLEKNKDSLVKEIGELKGKIQNNKDDRELILKEFENLSNKILENQSESFKNKSKESLENIINPHKNQIQNTQKELKEIYDKINENLTLNTNSLNQVSEETKKLNEAFKYDSQKRGKYGEFLLIDGILNKAGLEKGIHYKEQPRVDETGESSRVDVLLDLNNKKILIDSKFNINALMEQKENEDYLKKLYESIKKAIDNLFEKDYINKYQGSFDVIFLFIPLESIVAHLLMYQEQNLKQKDLFEYAVDKGVILTSPYTLLFYAKQLFYVWKDTKIQENIKVIKNLFEKLEKSFTKYESEMSNIKQNLDKAQAAYNNAYKRLFDTSNQGDHLKAIVNKFLTLKDIENIETNSELESNSLI